MKNIFSIVLLVCLFIFTIDGQTPVTQQEFVTILKRSADGKREYTEVSNDPTKTRYYKLRNGLSVILSENHLEPVIMSLIVTKAGSKHDPADNTGLAHYLEHMLFKGTDKFGTKDYEKEKQELDRIQNLYEEYKTVTDKIGRKSIYHRIDSISLVASRYAIANEYDKMMADVGSNMTNAFTSFENTTYMEKFPANNLDKFLTIQAERFRNPVLRLFHTELEAVYEEKNISMDDGDNKVFDQMMSSLFKKHPYGTQTTLGTVEHLKNPSMVEIRKYYDRYYVPGNMAIIMAGDLNPDEAIDLIEKHFASMAAKQPPTFAYMTEADRDSVEEYTLYSPDEEKVAIGYKFPGALHKDALAVDLISSILFNGKSGLLDKVLILDQKILDGYAFSYLMKDHGIFYFEGKPLEGQTLEEVRDLFLNELRTLRSGNFDPSLINGTVNNLKLSRIRRMEDAQSTAFILHDLFVLNRKWVDYLNEPEKMGKITREDIMRAAAKYFQKNYTVIYKRTGTDTSVQKVVKPEIHPVDVNREDQSEFLKTMVSILPEKVNPVFLDYKKDIKISKLSSGIPVWYVANTTNQLFNLYYQYDFGSDDNNKLPVAAQYLKYLGTQTCTNEEINRELYNLGLDWNISVGADNMTISMSGLEENFQKGFAILNDIFTHPKVDEPGLEKLKGTLLKARQDALIDVDIISSQALTNYLKFGAVNPFNAAISNSELRNIKSGELISIISGLKNTGHTVMYYGPQPENQLIKLLDSGMKPTEKIVKVERKNKFIPLEINTNKIYFVEYDMVQAEILFSRRGPVYDASNWMAVNALNEYYGGGMQSVVFQDIRESKALAYSANSRLATPDEKNRPYMVTFYVGTQADKFNEAMAAILNLLNNMPESEKLWELSKNSILSRIRSERINKDNILFNYYSALKIGHDSDIRKDIFDQAEMVSLSDVKAYHENFYKDKAWNIGVVGSKDNLNMNDLRKYGELKVLTLRELFGYDASDF